MSPEEEDRGRLGSTEDKVHAWEVEVVEVEVVEVEELSAPQLSGSSRFLEGQPDQWAHQGWQRTAQELL